MTASIFGEAGAEWAIPERHEQRTAELIDSARRASGFSWGEILSRTGGLNAGSGASYVYSPTIYAGNDGDLDRKLKDSEERMRRWVDRKEREAALMRY